MKIVVKIGGSVSISEKGPRPEYMKKLIPVLKELKRNHSVYIVIGGGRITRNYYECIKEFLPPEKAEWVLIELLHANARFLAYALGAKFCPRLEDVSGDFTVSSGFEPGHSTDGSAALVAEKVGADIFIMLTDVNGVYEDDVKLNPDAKLLKHISFDELDRFSRDGSPNNYGVIDKLAIDIIKKNKIKTYIVGKEPENILKVVSGENPGTEISF